jgi:transcriptional regulator NrdR family protein
MSWQKCPECGKAAWCTDSRPKFDAKKPHFVRRRYECKNRTPHRFTTIELLASDLGIPVVSGMHLAPKTRRLTAQIKQAQRMQADWEKFLGLRP